MVTEKLFVAASIIWLWLLIYIVNKCTKQYALQSHQTSVNYKTLTYTLTLAKEYSSKIYLYGKCM